MTKSKKLAHVVYEPENTIRYGVYGMFKEMFGELSAGRWLTKQLLMRDIRASYQQSLLGVLWLLIAPAFTIGTFYFLNRNGILVSSGLIAPFMLFGMMGMAFWMVFSGGIISGTSCLVDAGTMIKKINFPRESLVIAAVSKVFIDFTVVFTAATVLLVYYRLIPSYWIIFTPFLILPVYFFTLGLAFILSMLNGIFRDIQKIVPVAVAILMFATPIFWYPSSSTLPAFIRYNPLFYLINVPRQLILRGSTAFVGEYIVCLGLCIGMFVFCWVLFHLAEKKIAEMV